MTIETLSGKDSLILDGELIEDGADADCVTIEFPNDSALITRGKNGNSLITKNEQGKIINITLRVCLNGKTDKYLVNKLSQFNNDPTSYATISGTFTKRTGDGQGNLTKKIFDLTGGVVVKNAGTMDSTVGNVDSVVSVYNLTFANGEVAIN